MSNATGTIVFTIAKLSGYYWEREREREGTNGKSELQLGLSIHPPNPTHVLDPTTCRQLQMSRQLSSGSLSIIIKKIYKCFQFEFGSHDFWPVETDPTGHNLKKKKNYISSLGLSLSLSLTHTHKSLTLASILLLLSPSSSYYCCRLQRWLTVVVALAIMGQVLLKPHSLEAPSDHNSFEFLKAN